MASPRDIPTPIRTLINVIAIIGVGASLMGYIQKDFGVLILVCAPLYFVWEIYPWTVRATQRRPRVSLAVFIIVGAAIGAGSWFAVRRAAKASQPTTSTATHIGSPPPSLPHPAAMNPASPQNMLIASPPKPRPASTDDPVGHLSKLGWAIKRDGKLLQFEIANSPLPDMAESALYFNGLKEPFKLHFQSVPNLVGLEKLSRVERCEQIDINASDLTAISELSEFVHLKRLGIGQVPLNAHNSIDSSPFAGLVNLEELTLYGSRFTDVAYIGTMSKLKKLSVGGTLIRDLSPVAALHGLTTVDVRDSKVTDLSPLAQSKGLKDLTIDGKQVANLAVLSGNRIEKLMVIEMGGVDLTPIGSLIHLDILSIWGPPVMDLTFLRRLPALTSLSVSGLGFPTGNRSQVLQPSAICSNGSLKTLTLGQLQISSLGFVAGCAKLTEINLSGLLINSINELAGVPTLKKVSLSDVPVVEISPLAALPNLETLYLMRVPARADVISALERKGVKVTNP